MPANGNPFFAELAKAVEDAAFERGHPLLLANSGNNPERERPQLGALRDRQVDGLLVIGTTADTVRADLDGPDEHGLRIVFRDRAVPEMNYPSVVVDNESGARVGVEHL